MSQETKSPDTPGRFKRLGGHGPLRTRRSWLDAWAEAGERGAA